MGAQLIDSVSEVMLMDSDDSILVLLADGRTLELFGDGFVQIKAPGAIIEEFDFLVVSV